MSGADNSKTGLPLDMAENRRIVVIGKGERIHVWAAPACTKVMSYNLLPGSQGIIKVSISPCSNYVVCVDKRLKGSPQGAFRLTINHITTKKLISIQSSVSPIQSLAWSKFEGDTRFATVSLKAIKFW
jgi:hypothetical protein